MSSAKRADTAAITPDKIHSLMQDMSASTMRELGGLIADLETLRDRLLADGKQAERNILDYARLGQSVIQLTTIASQGTVVVKQPIIDH